jgi:2-amino-4-hydroxy-6-hydroxymethyldihydropteridine diphosphokinase
MIRRGTTSYLGLGSNLGDRVANLRAAILYLGKSVGVTVNKYSSIYHTEPVGVSHQPNYYNAVVEIKTTLSPHELLEVAKNIEYAMGREPYSHYMPRNIDIDILTFGDSEVDSLDLRIPHSRLTRRAFVLVPLLELKPDMVHPTSFRPLREYLEELGDSQKVERVPDAGDFTRES